jgi:uncharacterized membrane protein YjgN (DUF898 family)
MALTQSLPQRFQSKARLPFHTQNEELQLAKEVIKNSWLTIISLGFYYPFAINNLRQLVWRNTSFEKKRFEYTGDGKALLKGYITVLGFFGLSALSITLLRSNFPTVGNIFGIALGLFVIFALIPRALYSFRRFLLNRTKYRGIRLELKLHGQIRFTSVYIFGLLLSIMTLGLYTVFTKNRLDRILWNHSSLGNQKFFNTSEGIVLFWEYLRGFLLSIPTLGIYSFWMQARILRYKARNLYLGHHNFKLNITGKDILLLTLKDLAIIIVTLGIGGLWIPLRHLAFYSGKLTYCGQIDYARIEQVLDEPGDAFAESFGDLLNVDLGL